MNRIYIYTNYCISKPLVLSDPTELTQEDALILSSLCTHCVQALKKALGQKDVYSVSQSLHSVFVYRSFINIILLGYEFGFP